MNNLSSQQVTRRSRYIYLLLAFVVVLYLTAYITMRLSHGLVHYSTRDIGAGVNPDGTPMWTGRWYDYQSVDVGHLLDYKEPVFSAPYYLFWPLCKMEEFIHSLNYTEGDFYFRRYDVTVGVGRFPNPNLRPPTIPIQAIDFDDADKATDLLECIELEEE